MLEFSPKKIAKSCKRLGYFFVVLSILGLAIYIFEETTTVYYLLFSLEVLLFGMFFLHQAKKQEHLSEKEIGGKTVSLELYILSCLLGLIIIAIILFQAENVPASVATFSLIATGIIAIIIAIKARKKMGSALEL
jgi:hypothetical protein